ncbi:hypothetical protein NPX13_g3581 [Xylaria arbuscula]|uniref:Transmembrane protein n=1 Tax=Xylaria arbuscula TaxID=114810 RepID=A0A9W8TPY8_9PEZI|nr:hypothetical protein NPX13_g3581 [Xylaria arbuscula]
MMVLLAPTPSVRDRFIKVSSVYAWHSPIVAGWEVTDITLFPPEVMSTKSSIAKYGWTASPASVATSTSSTLTPSESITSAPQESNEPEGISLDHGVIVGIVIAIVAFFGFAGASVYAYRRHRRRQNKPGGGNTASSHHQGIWLENAWRAEMSSPGTPSQVPAQEDHNRRPEKQTTTKLDSGPIGNPAQR